MQRSQCKQVHFTQRYEMDAQYVNTKDKYLSKLKSILNDKNLFLQIQHQKKYHKKAKKIKNNYQIYLAEHQKQLQNAFATNCVYLILQTCFSQRKNYCFQHLKQYVQYKNENKQSKQFLQENYILSLKQNSINKINAQNLIIKKIMLKNIQRIQNSINRCLLNDSFRKIKQLIYTKQIQCQVNDISLDIEKIRIMNFNCSSQIQKQIKLSQNSIGCQMLDLSAFQNPDISKQLLQLQSHQNERELREELNKLNLQFHCKIVKYQVMKEDIYSKLGHYFDVSNDQQSVVSSVKSKFKEAQKGSKSLKQKDSMISSSYDEEQKEITDEAIIQLLQRNEELEQEIDRIQTTVEDLLRMAITDRNINPQLLVILREVKDILAPNPLGHSLIMK